ncbi:hypothetical protein Scep_028549 [Stephania cephalantha]|uniref:Uncharacterized protein n=1 Tax=Stephania cephalantha TaxID=152367 RepID=A0AAP0EDD0_9MAGN
MPVVLDVDLHLIPRVITSSSHELSHFDRIIESENSYAYKLLRGLNYAGGLDDERALALGELKELGDSSEEYLCTSYGNLKKLELITILDKDSSFNWLASLLDCCSSKKNLSLRLMKILKRNPHLMGIRFPIAEKGNTTPTLDDEDEILPFQDS